MKSLNRRLLVIVILAALSASLSRAAQAQETENPGTCSTATVAGSWGFTLTGTLISGAGIPVGAVGRVTADENGKISGAEARSLGGAYADETIRGSWTVKTDCSGELSVSVYDDSGQLARTSVTSVVFDQHSSEFRMVQKSLKLPDGTPLPVVITIEGKKM